VLAQVTDELAAHLAVDELFGPCLRPDRPGSEIPPDRELSEVSSVGLTHAQAQEILGSDRIATVEYNLAGNGKSQILGTTGFIKLIREKDGPVVGIDMVSARVGELVGQAQLAVSWEAHPEDLAPLIHAHPTQNEAFDEAFLALAGQPPHAHS
jgi:dihydrolipoamide dehydrogenase